MLNPSGPIGIFDSGVGGLTVARAVTALLGAEDLVYLGDTARVPYGSKSPVTVRRYALNTARFLMKKGAKLLVVACNTASAVALEDLRAALDIPVLGVIEPGAREAVSQGRSGSFGVLATEATIYSGAYQRAIRLLAPEAEVIGIPCPLLVPLAEEGWVQGHVTEEVIRHYVAPLRGLGVDTLVLGCTHYPLLKGTIARVVREEVGEGVKLIDSAEAVARTVVEALDGGGLRKPLSLSQAMGRRSFFVTDCPDRLFVVGSRFFGGELGGVEQVDL